MDTQARTDRARGVLVRTLVRVSAVEQSMGVLADTSLENRIDVEHNQRQLNGLQAAQQQMLQKLALLHATQQQLQQTLTGLQQTQQQMQATLTQMQQTLTGMQRRTRSRSRPAIGAGTRVRR